MREAFYFRIVRQLTRQALTQFFTPPTATVPCARLTYIHTHYCLRSIEPHTPIPRPCLFVSILPIPCQQAEFQWFKLILQNKNQL